MVLHKTRIIILLCTLCTGLACHSSKEEKKDPTANSSSELTQTQQTAFDALNTLQTGTDIPNRIYSTFPNIEQPCYPADTSFEVSQAELLEFMEQFVSKYCQKMSEEKRRQLTNTSVLAEIKYTILHCQDYDIVTDYKDGIPMTGTWVMPNVLGKRDVTLVW